MPGDLKLIIPSLTSIILIRSHKERIPHDFTEAHEAHRQLSQNFSFLGQ